MVRNKNTNQELNKQLKIEKYTNLNFNKVK